MSKVVVMVKRKYGTVEAKKEEEVPIPASVRHSDDPPPKRIKWRNKQRVLCFASRGITYRHRHLMEDLRTLLPHTKSDNKKEKKEALYAINEICDMKHCNKVIYFEGRKKEDLYMYISDVPEGPCMKFFVQNIHTMSELKLTGNCLRGSRALLSFSKEFDDTPHHKLMREMLTQFFSTPYHHPKSQPFVDHIFTFSLLDNRIWFRNYQIMEELGSLVEIGPRFVMCPIKILSKSFCGEPLWENPDYVSPNAVRRELRLKASGKYLNKQMQKKSLESRKLGEAYLADETDKVFHSSESEDEET